MANSNSSPSRLGLAVGGNDNYALFLKKFAGEVLTTFTTNNVFANLHNIRTIDSGKSAQFPITGVATAKYHTPGQSISDSGNSLTSTINHAEKIINVDSLLISSAFVANIDEMMNHYDVRSIYSTELGRALAQRFDQNIAKTLALGASDSSAVAGGGIVTSIKITSGGNYSNTTGVVVTFSAAPAGGVTATGTPVINNLKVVGVTITNPGSGYLTAPTVTFSGGTGTQATATAVITNFRAGSTVTLENALGADATGANIVDGLYKAAQLLDERNIPSSDRYCAMPAEFFYTMARSSTDLFNRFFGNTGTLSSVELPEVAGFKIVRSNNLPRYGVAANSGENNTYSGDFTALRALCFHKAAAGTVKLKDISVESEYQIDRQGTLFVAKYAMGHGILRPEGVVLVNAKMQ